MTDEAKTYAEIQALFADNATGDISAQDLRDAIISITAPVPAGGFAETMNRRNWFYLRSNPAGVVTIPAAGEGLKTDYFLLPMDPSLSGVIYNVDPQGWHDPTYSLAVEDPRNAYEWEIDPGAALTVPPGQYIVTAFVIFDTVIDPDTQYANAYFDQMEYGPDFDINAVDPSVEPWQYEGYFATTLMGAPGGTPYPGFFPLARYNGKVTLAAERITNDNPDSAPFGLIVDLFNTTTEVKVIYYAINVGQIGGPGW